MKKIFNCNFIILVCLSLIFVTLIGCTTEEKQKELSENIEFGIVQRKYQSDHRMTSEVAVRLTNGKMFWEKRHTSETPDDLFFLEKGDTLYYQGEKIIKVSFQN